MTYGAKRRLLLHITALFITALLAFSSAQPLPDESEYSALLATAASVPLSFEVGSTTLLSNEVGVLVGASVYPLPLLIAGEFNLDLTADLTYRRGVAPFYFIVGGGPRYQLVGSEWLPGRGAAGSYAGVGALAGAQIDLNLGPVDLLALLFQIGGDYTFGLSGGASASQLSLRTKIGVNIPFVGTAVF